MNNEATLVDSALRNWKQTLDRTGTFFGNLSEEQLLEEVAPGKNRLIYLWGHLIAVNDAMLPLLGIGPRLHPELDAAFVLNPDRAVVPVPGGAELKRIWGEINEALWAGFSKWSASEWVRRHNSVSEADFKNEPHRNRFTILLGRTGHIASHLGQAALAKRADA